MKSYARIEPHRVSRRFISVGNTVSYTNVRHSFLSNSHLGIAGSLLKNARTQRLRSFLTG